MQYLAVKIRELDGVVVENADLACMVVGTGSISRLYLLLLGMRN